MQQQQPDPNQFENDVRMGVNWLFFLLDAHATCITMFIRHSFGTNLPGFAAIGALALMTLTMLGQGDIRMSWMIEAWIVALVFQRLRSGYLACKGRQGHSYYGGHPWLAMMIPGTKTEEKAKNLEPALCLIIGVLLLPVSQAIGLYVMFGFVSLFLLRVMHLGIRRRQVVAMRDMEIEQRAMSERMRGTRKDF